MKLTARSDKDIAAVATNRALRPLHRDSHHSVDVITSVEAADIKWVLESFQSTLALYGYDKLYQTWLKVATSTHRFQLDTHEEAQWAAKMRAAMAETSAYANWGEVWYR